MNMNVRIRGFLKSNRVHEQKSVGKH